MAISKAKGSVGKKQSEVRSQKSAGANLKAKNGRQSEGRSQKSVKTKAKTKKKQSAFSIQQSAGANLKAKNRTQSAHSRQKTKQQTKPRSKPYPGELALQQRNLSDRRFVCFPVAEGKTVQKIEFYTSREYHCLRLDFRDRTFLALRITPRFTLNVDYQQHAKDEPVTLAEWPAIHGQT